MKAFLACAAVLAFAVGAQAQGELNIGDKAPKLEVGEFVKGEPVKELKKGQNYVVEFWATWCGPCRTTIPHLTKLQKQYKDVTFIGVSVWERDESKVKPFVEKMGEQMDYRVAMDKIPEGKKADEGSMAKNWMTAAAQDGIPSAFIVNGEGLIAWIGHPAEMDKPLADVVAGKWDVKAAAAKFKEEKALERKMSAIFEKLQESMVKKDTKGAIKVIDEALKEDAKLESKLGPVKLQILMIDGNADATATYGRRLFTEVLKDDANTINMIAYSLVDPDAPRKEKLDPKIVKLAMEMAEKANSMTGGQKPDILDTMAAAHFASGNVAKAIEIQEKACKLAPTDKDLAKHLETFKASLEKKDDKKKD